MKKEDFQNSSENSRIDELHREWLDETGEIPRVSGWLDETDELPQVREWLDETDELPQVREWPGEMGEIPQKTEWLDETGEIPQEAEWLDETDELPQVKEWLDETGELWHADSRRGKTGMQLNEAEKVLRAAKWPDETDELPKVREWLDETGEISPVRPEDAWKYEDPEDSSDPEKENTLRASGAEETEEVHENELEMQETASEEAEEDTDSDREAEAAESIPRLILKDWDDRLDEEPENWFAAEEIDEYYGAVSGQNTRGSAECENLQTEGNDNESTGESPQDGGDIPRQSGCRIAGIRKIWERLQNEPKGDRLFVGAAAALGTVIVIAAAAGWTSYSWNQKLQAERSVLAEVGENLPGDQVLNTDAFDELAQLRIEEEEEREKEEEAARKKAQKEAEQDEEEESVAVDFTLSTIQSDLKIKIRRQKEQSLIGGVPFTVKVKDPNGKTTEQTDTDEDGIIYLTGLSSGKYEVALCSLIDLDELKQEDNYRENEEYLLYSKYKISEESQTIQVTDSIAYEVVDVSDEVKSASEVNTAKEDTAKNDTPVESTVKDTVEWVESTQTEVDGEGGESSYEEVSKSEIPDPYATAYLAGSSFSKLSEVTESSEENKEENKEEKDKKEQGEDEMDESDTSDSDAAEDSQTKKEQPQDEEGQQEPELKVDPSEIHLVCGNTQTIKASVTNASDTTVTYVSSDADIATVSDGGTVQGISAGNCTITVALKDYGDVTQTVSVTVSEKTDDSTPLKDADGNPLYVKDGDGYRAATAADYSSFDVFYRKTVTEKKYRYTGWQHINGLTYYYDKNGNYVTGSQIIQGVSYTFSSEGILDTDSTNTGIDVSMWNGSIQWDEVASSGISFAIIRCGYRGSSTGALVKDSAVGTNITGARNAGLKVGLYFFSQAVNEAEAVEEASMAVQIAKSYGISMPIFLDVESSGGRGDSISTSQRTANIAAFCKTVQNAGFSAGVYANTNWFSEKINVSSLTSYHIWLAQYAETPTYSRSRYDIWQYSASGRINGISGDVDLDISYRSY
jgi:GH25 family lysozyme M1 (1,4-beta-N-acetylmuramidase)